MSSFLAHRRAAKKRTGSQRRVSEQVERSIRRAGQAKSRAEEAAERGRDAAAGARRQSAAAKRRAQEKIPD